MRTMSGHPVPGLQPRRHSPRPPGRTARLGGLLLCLLLLGGAGTVHAQAADPNRAIAVAKKLELLQRYLGSASAETAMLYASLSRFCADAASPAASSRSASASSSLTWPRLSSAAAAGPLASSASSNACR